MYVVKPPCDYSVIQHPNSMLLGLDPPILFDPKLENPPNDVSLTATSLIVRPDTCEWTWSAEELWASCLPAKKWSLRRLSPVTGVSGLPSGFRVEFLEFRAHG